MFGLVLVCSSLLAVTTTEPAALPEALKTYEDAQAHVGRDAGAHVKLALWCEAQGLNAERVKHLAIAVLTDPKNAAARGLMGLVAYRGQWKRPEAVAEKVRDDEALAAALAEYNARREVLPETADAHFKLALWCEQKGLKAEAIAHFTAVTRLPPPPHRPTSPIASSLPLFGPVAVPHHARDHREAAWERLGFRRHDGRWMTEAQILAEKIEADKQLHANRRWKLKLEKWRGWLAEEGPKHHAADEALREVTDPRAVPAVWAVFALGDAGDQAEAVRVLAQIDAPTASEALALLATFSTTAEARRTAAENLVRRDPRDFVGLVIGLLRDPLKYEVRSVAEPGTTGVLFVEGKRYNVQRLYKIPAMPRELDRTRGAADTRGARLAIVNAPAEERERLNLVEAQKATLATQEQMAGDIAQIEAYNRAVEQTNSHALLVLNTVTGQDLGRDGETWQAWWTDREGYAYEPPKSSAKPTYDRLVPAVYTPTYAVRHSCFGAGTPVRTLNGPRPIESIRVGDQVLSQDTRTGTLSFEPVLAVFHNKPAPTIRIGLGDESIIVTGIHRFWRPGRGWAMARDLKPGDAVRTLGETARVASVESDAVQPVFNLEVARGRSFFVGSAGALVHDNSLVVPVTEPFDAGPTLAAAGRD